MSTHTVVAASDLHGRLIDIPPCDLLLLGGDLCPAHDHSLRYQASWLNSDFRAWLERVPARHIIGVAGNHDFLFEQDPERVPQGLRWEYLQDSGTTWEGYSVWGSPWQPAFCDWAFNATETKLKQQWSLIPEDTQLLLLHGPPQGYGDSVPARSYTADSETEWPQSESVGCSHLLERIKQLPRLRLAVFGHIHSGSGIYSLPGKIAQLANASVVDEQYQVAYRPKLFRLSPNDIVGTHQPLAGQARQLASATRA